MTQSEPRVVSTAAALIIGSELLSGKIRDENFYHLSQTLRALGIQLGRVIICPDDLDTITRDVRELKASHDVVFTSGGVGPTHDDITMNAVAAALEVPVVSSPEMEALIHEIYGAETTESHLLMARVPQGAVLATAPDLKWPTVVADDIWILPGVPELFKMKLSLVREKLRGPQPFFTRSVYLQAPETDIKEELDRLVAEHPTVEMGSYPKWFDKRYQTRLTVDAREEADANKAEAALRESFAAHLVDLEG